ncbi:hypothetical protein B0T13DRAFT_476203 [Neurospora crassa]|nr:hypothetical protein B0T13DRAFT_484917 [Neurospora crassa]KAK3493319.1 hypothetical protein B0T13DRAFT_476203 [Neurospora crassa]
MTLRLRMTTRSLHGKEKSHWVFFVRQIPPPSISMSYGSVWREKLIRTNIDRLAWCQSGSILFRLLLSFFLFDLSPFSSLSFLSSLVLLLLSFSIQGCVRFKIPVSLALFAFSHFPFSIFHFPFFLFYFWFSPVRLIIIIDIIIIIIIIIIVI